MQSCLTKKLKESKPFAKFLERVAIKTEYMDGLHLSDLLIMPVQRLPRYGLFIGDLLNYLPEHMKKSSGLRLAMDQIKTLGRQVEQYMSDALLRKLQLRFGSDCKIVKPGRRLVSEGVLTQKDSFFRSKRFMVLLFNDCVMFYLEGESKIDETILMVDIVEVRPTKKDSKVFEMKLQPFAEYWGSQTRVLKWEADNKYEKISWVNTLKGLIENSKKKHGSHEGSTSSTCTGICGNKHDAYSRRCVVCGVVFCRDCKKRGMTKLSHRKWRCQKHGGGNSPDMNDRKGMALTTSSLHSSSTSVLKRLRERVGSSVSRRSGSASSRNSDDGKRNSSSSNSSSRSPPHSPSMQLPRSNTLQFF